MEGWKKDNIQKIFNLGRGRVISQTEVENTLGVYPVYSSQSQNNGEMGRINTYDFNGDYVTWTTDGAYAGTVFFRRGKFNCTNVCGTLKAIDENNIDHQFFAYLFSVVSKKYVSYVGNPKLMNGIVAKIPLFYPKLVDEQRKIAKILSTVDKVIEQTELLIAKYRHIKQGLMHDLLTYGVDSDGNIRNPKTHKFEIKNGILVPSDWEVEKFDFIFDVISGATPSTSDDVFWKDEIIWITPNDLNKINHVYINNSERKISIRGLNSCATNLLPKGAIIMSSRAPIGYLALATTEYCTNQGCKSFIIKDKGNHSSEFHYFNIQFNIDRFKLLGTGTTFLEISKKDINSIYLSFPYDKNEQNKIAEILLKQDRLIEKEEMNLSKYKKIKQGLMHDLLTPTKRVKL